MKIIGTFLLLVLLVPLCPAHAQFPDSYDQGPPFPAKQQHSQSLIVWEQDLGWKNHAPVPGQLFVRVRPTVTDEEARDLFLRLGYVVLEAHLLQYRPALFRPLTANRLYALPERSEMPLYRVYAGKNADQEMQRLHLLEPVQDVERVYWERWHK